MFRPTPSDYQTHGTLVCSTTAAPIIGRSSVVPSVTARVICFPYNLALVAAMCDTPRRPIAAAVCGSLGSSGSSRSMEGHS